MPDLPSGIVTFLYTDIEGSTRLWEQHPAAMRPALARHDAIIRAAVAQHGGSIFSTAGDAFSVAFAHAADALAAALAMQRGLFTEDWGEVGAIKVRMAIHSGEASPQQGDYVGVTVNRIAQLLSAAHGGQVILSRAAAQMLQDQLSADVTLRDMGERRLKDLSSSERIYQLVAADLPSEFPPLRTLDMRRHNLPAQATPLVGREQEIAALGTLLRRPNMRLVTLTGPGGSGKTRLSLAVAADLRDDFDEVSFVPLATVSDPALVLPTIAQTLGLKEEAGRSLVAALRDYLSNRKLLLVLDNFEQVVAAANDIEMLLAAPNVKLLVSSREVLHLYGEQEYPVPPLASPNLAQATSAQQIAAYPAVQLFLARAAAVKYDFALNADNAAAIAEICARLDGLPLAIELAAARVKHYYPAQIAAQLDNRLHLLTDGARDLPARQRSLRGAIDWSYHLLDAAEQQLFARLSVFVGGFSLAAAEQVCGDEGDTLDLISSLVDKSLLRLQFSDDDPRFLMLETIREYAMERLNGDRYYSLPKAIHEYATDRLAASGEAETMHHHHATYFADFAAQAENELVGAQQAHWLNRLEQEHDNIRAALNWLLGHDAGATALSLAGAIWRFWYARGYLSEGRRWLAAALAAAPQADPATQAKALNASGNLAYVQGDYEAATDLLTRSLALRRGLNDQPGIATSLSNLGLVATGRGDYQQAQTYYEQSLAIRQASGNQRAVVQVLNNLGLLAIEREDYPTAQQLFAQCLTISRQLDDASAKANALHNVGEAAYYQADYETAAQMCSESLAIYRTLGSKQGTAYSLYLLAAIALDCQDWLGAKRHLSEALPLLEELSETRSLARVLGRFAILAQREGRAVAATQLLGAMDAAVQKYQLRIPSIYQNQLQQTAASTRAELSTAEFDTAWVQGAAMSLAQGIEYALRYAEVANLSL